MVTIDGTCLDLSDTPANDSGFGRPGVSKGECSAFPQARVVALAECGTHAIFDAVIGPSTTSENALSTELIARLRSGMLCLADRGFYSFNAWENACSTGADLLWRVRDNLKLESVEDLPDGSFLADVFDSVADRRRERPARVRVIEYMIADGREAAGPFRLITTLLDHRQAAAAGLAATYVTMSTGAGPTGAIQSGPTRALLGPALHGRGWEALTSSAIPEHDHARTGERFGSCTEWRGPSSMPLWFGTQRSLLPSERTSCSAVSNPSATTPPTGQEQAN